MRSLANKGVAAACDVRISDRSLRIHYDIGASIPPIKFFAILCRTTVTQSQVFFLLNHSLLTTSVTTTYYLSWFIIVTFSNVPDFVIRKSRHIHSSTLFGHDQHFKLKSADTSIGWQGYTWNPFEEIFMHVWLIPAANLMNWIALELVIKLHAGPFLEL